MSDIDDGVRLSSDVVKVETGYMVRVMLGRFLARLCIVALVITGFYMLSIVPTVVRFIPTTNMGVVLTKNTDMRMGVIPKGSVVYTRIGTDNGLLATVNGRWTLGVAPQSNVSMVRVLTRDDGRLTIGDDGWTNWNGRHVSRKQPVNMPAGGWLTDSYLVECTGGACRHGQLYVTSTADIIGQRVGGSK